VALFWSLPVNFLSGTSAATGIALINSLGNPGGLRLAVCDRRHQ
jgi:ACS family tartrate transporter-like MFS transporter